MQLVSRGPGTLLLRDLNRSLSAHNVIEIGPVQGRRCWGGWGGQSAHSIGYTAVGFAAHTRCRLIEAQEPI